MKQLLLLCTFLAGLFFFAPHVSAQSYATPFKQVNLLHVVPADAAAFVPLAVPFNNDPPKANG